MTFRHKPNRGSTFHNDKKELDTHPDRNGSCVIQCPHCKQEAEYYINEWGQEKNGKYIHSFSFKWKGGGGMTEYNQKSEFQQSAQQAVDNMQDIPF